MKSMHDYYEQYKTSLGDGGTYTMTKNKDTSRVRFLKKFVKQYVPNDGKILDVGCGDMHLAEVLPQYEWTGIDIAPNMSDGRAIAHELMNTPYPFEAGTFDAVVCSEVLEHLWDLRVVHQEVKRLLKPQGTYILSTPNYNWIDHHLAGFRQLLFDPSKPHLFEHIRQYTQETHALFLSESGFEVRDYVGADNQYSELLLPATTILHDILTNQLGANLDITTVDMMVGIMFKKWCHTIMLVAKPGDAK